METPILRPLSIAELLDKALQIYKKNALLFLSIFGVVVIPVTILSSLMMYFLSDSQLVDIFLGGTVSIIAELACVFAISEFYLGRQVVLQEAFRKGGSRFWSRVGAGILIAISFIPIIIVVFLVSLARLQIIGFILFIPFVIFLTTRWSLVTPIIVIEGRGVVNSLERSWNLTDKYFWRVFGTSFAAGLLSMLLSTLPSLLITYFFEITNSVPPQVALIVVKVVENLAMIITSPLTLGVNVLIYYDLRIRKEGFDLEFMASNEKDTLQSS